MNTLVKTDMLILARESRGLTQSELAQTTGVSQANISKYESGLQHVPDESLAKIAAVLEYPPMFFMLSDPRYGFGSSCTYHRKRATMPVLELKRLLAQINVHRIRVARLLNNVEIEAANQFPRLDIHRYGGDPARIAQIVRASWKLRAGPVPNLVQVIENAGGIVFRCSFGTTKLDAISQWAPGLPPVFFINADMPGDRVRFTLAHEIGHLVMHQIPDDATIEDEANRFAAEFLMPTQDIDSALEAVSFRDFAQLKLHWRVSIRALIQRAVALEKITPRQQRTFYGQLTRLGYRLNEPVPIPVEEPILLRELINVHVKDLHFTYADLSELMFASEEEIREWAGQTRTPLRFANSRQRTILPMSS